MSFSRPDLRQLEQQFISKREDYEKLLKSWVLAEKSVLAVIGDHGIPGVKRLEAQRCLHAFLRLSFVETKAVALGDKVEFRRYFDHILGSFSYKPSVGEDSIVLAKICKLGLKSLQLLLTSGVGVDPVAHLLGTLTHLCSYGLPGYRFQIPPPIVPSSLGKVDVEEIETAAESSKSFTASKITKRSRGGRKKAGKHAKENNPKPGESKPEKRDPRFWSEDPTEWLAENSLNPMATTTWRNTKTWLTNIESSSSSTGNGVPSSVLISSDSEVSDVETKPKESEARVRRESLEALRAAFKCLSKEAVTSYWWAFMPRATEGRLTTNTTITSGAGNESIDNDCWTLVSALVREPSCKCRFSAAVALDHYLKQCKLFIAVGEERRGTQAFTPFAVELGESLMEVHKGLRLAVAQETSPITLIQILNTINTLVALTPFRRFAHAGLLKALVSDIKKFLAPQNRMNQFGGGSNSLAVGVLTVLGTMIRCHPNVKEVEEVLCESLDDESWVVVHCCGRVLEALSAEEDGGKVKPIVAEVIQCLGVLNEVCKHYPTHLIGRDQEHWPDLKRILVKGLASPQIQLHVAKFIPTVASVLMLGKNLTDGQPAAWETLSAERQEKFWLELLSGPLPTLFQKLDLACLRASACDCLAAIGDSVLESLPSRMRLMCLSLLVGQAYDELPTARASAIRGLGIYVLLPSLMEDDSFVLDVCNAVKAGLNSESHTVKVNAAWALGNVTDALVAWTSREKRGECESLDNVVPLNVYLDILNEAVLGTEEKHNFKVRHSAVRSIGGLIKCIPENWIGNPKVMDLANIGYRRLIDRALCDKDMKARWNSCYAISCALSNENLDSSTLERWSKEATCELQPLMTDFKNLKVRIRAAAVVLAVSERSSFGDTFLGLWKALIFGIENVRNIADFCEYQHVSGVVEQYCRALAHLSVLATQEDLQALVPLLADRCDMLEEQVLQAGTRIVPGKADFLMETVQRLTAFQDSNPLMTPSQKQGVALLIRIFGRATRGDAV